MSRRFTPPGSSAATRTGRTARTRPSPARRSPRSSTAFIRSLEPAVPADPEQNPAEITLRTTEPMIDFIKQKEGFQEKAAWDYAQYSIGYGSACGRDEYPNGITEAQADVLLRQMLQGF